MRQITKALHSGHANYFGTIITYINMTKPIMNIRTHTYNVRQHKSDAIEVHKCNLMHCNGQ